MPGDAERPPEKAEPLGLADPHAPWEELIEDPEAPRRLLAVMFTDIVGSTELAVTLGDRRWRELVDRHHAAVREAIARFGGTEVDTAGDAFFATFELPVRAVDCALEAIRAVRRLGLRIRAGVHMGECVVSAGHVRGVTVHIGARVAAKAGGGRLLVSSTVRDVLAGAGLKFEDRGEHVLKGVQGRWRLYEARPRVADDEADLPPLLKAEIVKPIPPLWRRRHVIVAAATVVALLAGTVAYEATRGPGGLSSVPADSVAVVNASSGAVERAVAVRRRPVGLAAAPDGVWVANSIDRSVTQVRPDGSTETIPVGPGPIAVAVGANFVWVANGDASTVSRVSPKTGGEAGPRIQAGNGLSAVAYGAGALWVANSVDGTIWRVDPATGRKTMEVAIGPVLSGLAVTDDAVWVTSETAGTLTRVDPRTGVIVRVIRVGNGPVAIAASRSAVWVANGSDGTVSRIDPATGGVTTRDVGRGPRAVAIAGGHVFVANEDDGTISMLDAGNGTVLRTIPLRNAPMGMAAVGDRVWVTVRGGILSYRGGTLRFGSIRTEVSLDPAMGLDPTVYWLVTPAVYDGLTAFTRVGGPEGNQLVPNLAEEIRPPTDEGTTYTFTLRPGLRFSDGTLVRASDVLKTFERILRIKNAYGTAFATIVKGSDKCGPQKPCDLSAGIVTDDAARTIVFHLRHALADFPAQLALPSLSILPGNSPPGDSGLTLIPGTGPYRFSRADFDKKKERGTILMERSQYFHPRGAAQPDGYADRIEITLGGTLAEHIEAVEAGREDLVLDLADNESSLVKLTTEFPAQVHVFDMPWNLFLSLNTAVPPFNDVRARQALNLAVDRAAMITAGATPILGDVSCQILPKNTVGYVPYCPYTKAPNASGLWSAPDLERARRLVATSGTKDQSVRVWVAEDTGGFDAVQRRRIASVVASTLRSIGYRASIATIHGDYFTAISDPKSRHQVSLMGWITDYPAASNFVLPLLTCPATVEKLTGGDLFASNTSHFCRKDIDALTERALAVQQDDPAAARDRWDAVDRALTDAAPIVPWASLRNAAFVSSRVGNVLGHAVYYVLLTQMWVAEPGSTSPRPG